MQWLHPSNIFCNLEILFPPGQQSNHGDRNKNATDQDCSLYIWFVQIIVDFFHTQNFRLTNTG